MVDVLSDVVSLSPVYGVLAIGFVLVYRFTGVLNFAHGGLTALGAYIVYFGSTRLLFSPPASFLLSAVAAVVVAVVVYTAVIRPMNGRPIFATVLVTIGLSIVLDSVIQFFWGSRPRDMPSEYALAREVHHVPGLFSIATADILMWALYATILVAVLGTLRWTRFGIQGKAAAEDPLLAAYRGINIQSVFIVTWCVAVVTAFLAGGLYATNHQVVPGIALLALKGFPVAMVGGLDSVMGTLVGAFAVATAEALAIHYIGPALADVVPYALMLVVLLVRPWGLWGTKEELDRV